MNLRGANALVATVDGPVGVACARRLAAAGANLVACASSEEVARQAEAELRGPDATVVRVAADVPRADVSLADTALSGALQHLARLDAFVVIPQPPGSGALADIDRERFQRDVADVVADVYAACRRAAELMAADGRGGSIVVVVEGPGPRRGPQATFARDVAAGSLMGLVQLMAAELGADGVRVNAVRAQLGPYDPALPAPALGRLATADEVAAVVTFLVSPRAANVTGTVIPVDCGLRAVQ